MKKMLTDKQIEEAKKRALYQQEYGTPRTTPDDHNDSVRIAYEWLDAQRKMKKASCWPCKHIVEGWGKRHIPWFAVAVAAELHPKVFGAYPFLNIAKQLVLPSTKRLEGIGQAGRDHYECFPSHYGSAEFMTEEEWRAWRLSHPERCPIG
jgi:hypothetical protein